LEQRRRQSLHSGARTKVAIKAKEKIKTPTKNKENHEQQMAKRIKTLERPKRNVKLGQTPVAGLGGQRSGERVPMKAAFNSTYNSSGGRCGISQDADHTASSGETSSVRGERRSNFSQSDASLQRKRGRGVDSTTEKSDTASGNGGDRSKMVCFTKNTNGSQQTFNFACDRVESSSSSSKDASAEPAVVRFRATSSSSSSTSGFRARPAPATSEGFRPKLAKRRVTDFKEFHFHTEDRAQQRSQVNAIKAENLARLREIEERRRKEEEEKDRQEIRRLRETLVHKPMPIHHGTPLVISASSRRPTNPESPNLSYKQNKRES